MRWRRYALVAILVAGAAGAGWWQLRDSNPLPPGIAWSNGRLECDELDINTKLMARVAEILVEEGDVVRTGQVLARMDTRDLVVKLQRAKAGVEQAEQNAVALRAAVEQQRSVLVLATQELQRSSALAPRGYQTRETLDQHRQTWDAAMAGLQGAEARLNSAKAALEFAQHDVELIDIDIADSNLVAPRDGRIQYRFANRGEMLGVGAKLFTLLDTQYVYMDVYLPAREAGRIMPHADARVVLDTWPNLALPARVQFVEGHSQFTPKAVETKSERNELMFRVRVRVDSNALLIDAKTVGSGPGVRGLAYIKVDSTIAWPQAL